MTLFVTDLAFASVTAAVLTLATVAFSLQFAVSNILNLAFGELLTLAGYLAYTGVHYVGLSIWIAAGLGVVLTGLFAAALNHFVLTPFVRKGSGAFTLMIVTFSVSTIVIHAIEAIYGPDSFTLNFGNDSTLVRAGAFQLTNSEAVTIGLALGAVAVLEYVLHRTLLGRAMQAVVDNRLLAQACGIRTSLIADIAWFISGSFAGLAGLALALSTGTVNSLLGSGFLLLIFPAAFLGGIGSIYGALIASTIIAFSSDWGALWLGSQYSVVAPLVILLLILMFRPSGLFGTPIRTGH